MATFALSPSKLEKWRQHAEGEYNGTITKEKLLETITRKDVWTPQANFGSAFHAVMENGAEPYLNKTDNLYVIQDGQMPQAIVCEYSEIELADKFHVEYGEYMTWEVWGKAEFSVDHHLVKLNMRFDGLLGREVHEGKTTTHAADPKFYQRSLQWRCYCMALDIESAQYNVFPYKEPAPLAEGKTRRKNARDKREVLGHFPMRFHHEGLAMEQRLKEYARGLIDFCDRNDLTEYILAKPKL